MQDKRDGPSLPDTLFHWNLRSDPSVADTHRGFIFVGSKAAPNAMTEKSLKCVLAALTKYVVSSVTHTPPHTSLLRMAHQRPSEDSCVGKMTGKTVLEAEVGLLQSCTTY